MRIAVYHVPKRLSNPLKRIFGKVLVVHSQKLSVHTVDPKADIIVITLTSAVSDILIKKMPKLRGIVSASTGLNHINYLECKRLGIEVKNCPSYSANAVAELAIALAFAGLRNFGRMFVYGKILHYPPTVFYYTGSELYGKKCAVLGTGLIGSLIAKKLLMLGCQVVAYSRSKNKELLGLGVKYMPLPKVLRYSNLIFIALPSTPETYHLLGKQELSLIADGSGLINIARGEIIDSDLLLTNIDRFSFVAADVIEGEAAIWHGKPMPLRSVRELVLKKNFILVPHIGASTVESQARLVKEVISALLEIKKKISSI